jgi:hypothetical protein
MPIIVPLIRRNGDGQQPLQRKDGATEYKHSFNMLSSDIQTQHKVKKNQRYNENHTFRHLLRTGENGKDIYHFNIEHRHQNIDWL